MALCREVAGASMRVDAGEAPSTAAEPDIHDIVRDQSARRRASDPSVMR
jgi:hypothetical protein